MLKARINDLIFFGLSDENLRRLQLGQPIKFDGATIGLGGYTFVIMHGKDESAMIAELRDKLGLEIRQ